VAKYLALLLITAFATAQKPVKIVLVGDSTVNEEGGWGEGFRKSFGPPVEVINLAKNGRSSKSFRDEGLWAPALAAKADFILIQFGHNDEPGKGPDRETDPTTTYRANMIRYVDEARATGATPILVTSIVRRNFDADGKIKRDHLVEYVAAVRKIAAEKNVPLIDLYALTRAQSESLGPEGTSAFNATTKEGKPDTTHLSAVGRQEIGAIAAREFVRLEPSVKPQLLAQRAAFPSAFERQPPSGAGSRPALRKATPAS
jgi:lysophospholipase L1-like esterase